MVMFSSPERVPSQYNLIRPNYPAQFSLDGKAHAMNKPHILFHLTEAREAIQELIEELKSDQEYEFGNYRVEMGHLYHHVNSAWNGRDASKEAVDVCSQEDFHRWCQFPTDIELLSEPTI